MKITVGLVADPNTTVTLFLHDVEDQHKMQGWTKKNFKNRAVAYARRELETPVFPIEINPNQAFQERSNAENR